MELVLLLLISVTVLGDSPHCHSGQKHQPYKNLATKTPYSFIANLKEDVDLPHECQAEQIWLIARHGTRYPSKEGIRAITQRLPEIAREVTVHQIMETTMLCPETIQEISDWTPMMLTKDAKTLHVQGESEMILLAERYQMRFPNILPDFYEEGLFKFRSTNKQRSAQSQFYFATGLFGRDVAQRVKFQDVKQPHDPIIRGYKLCPKWQKEVKQNPESLKEQKLFETSDFFDQNLRRPVSERLGYRNELLDLSDIDAMYVGCVFGQAWHPDRVSPWCKVFTLEELEILEFREDLEHYYQDGHGHPLNGQVSCSLMNDLRQSFLDKTNGSVEHGVFYFSHSGAILKFLTYLGLYEDEAKLMHDNYGQKNIENRKWKTSHFNSFGSNIAFVLLKCDSSNKFKVGLFVNERLTRIGQVCDKEFWCNWDTFQHFYNKELSNCNFFDICDLKDKHESEKYLKNAVEDKF